MARSQIEAINFSGLKDTDVPDKELGLREIVRAQSVCGGQGFKDVIVKQAAKLQDALDAKQDFIATVNVKATEVVKMLKNIHILIFSFMYCF